MVNSILVVYGRPKNKHEVNESMKQQEVSYISVLIFSYKLI